MVGMLIEALMIVFLIRVIAARRMEHAAALKGYKKEEVPAFLLVVGLGVIGCLYVAALPDRLQREQNRKLIELLEKTNAKP